MPPLMALCDDVLVLVAAWLPGGAKHAFRRSCRRVYALPASALQFPVQRTTALAAMKHRLAGPGCASLPFWGASADRVVLRISMNDGTIKTAQEFCKTVTGLVGRPAVVVVQPHSEREFVVPNLDFRLVNWLATADLWPAALLELRSGSINDWLIVAKDFSPALFGRLSWCESVIDFGACKTVPLFPRLRNLVSSPYSGCVLDRGPAVCASFPALESFSGSIQSPLMVAALQRLAPQLTSVRAYTDGTPCGLRGMQPEPLRLPTQTVLTLAWSRWPRWITGGFLRSVEYMAINTVDPSASPSEARLFQAEEIAIVFEAAPYFKVDAEWPPLPNCIRLALSATLVWSKHIEAGVAKSHQYVARELLRNAPLLEALRFNTGFMFDTDDGPWFLPPGLKLLDFRGYFADLDEQQATDLAGAAIAAMPASTWPPRRIKLPSCTHHNTVRRFCETVSAMLAQRGDHGPEVWLSDGSAWECSGFADSGPGERIVVRTVLLTAEHFATTLAGPPTNSAWARRVKKLVLRMPLGPAIRRREAELVALFPSAERIEVAGNPGCYGDILSIRHLCVAMDGRLRCCGAKPFPALADELNGCLVLRDDAVEAACPWMLLPARLNARPPPRVWSPLWQRAYDHVMGPIRQRRKSCEEA